MRGAPVGDAMRWTAAVLAALLAAGCFGPTPQARLASAQASCRDGPATEHVLYFGPALRLQDTVPPAGYAPGNAFSSGFATDDLKEWLSDPVPSGLWLLGNVTLEFWVRSTGTPAPLATNPNSPGMGYQFFDQFGSNRTFQPAFATEYSDVAPMAGQVSHYTEVLAMPKGGFVLEAGDRVRVLLTDLALDGSNGGGHDVLFGGQTPSQVRFAAHCWPAARYDPQTLVDQAVSMPGNQGLLTGAVPKSPVNQVKVPVNIPPGTQRLTVTLMQTNDRNPAKDDVDVSLLDRSGRGVWSIGSPYSNETGTLWAANLDAAFPDGTLVVEVESYSGVAYTGHLTVTAEGAGLP